MNNLSQYITEKLHINKDIIKNLDRDLKSFDKWKEYLEENGVEFFQFHKGGGVYALYLKKSNYKYKDTENKWVDKFTVPFLEISIDDLKNKSDLSGWDFYYYTDGKVEIYTDSNDSNQITLIPVDKDMDKNNSAVDGKYKFTVKNADFIIENLNKSYGESK